MLYPSFEKSLNQEQLYDYFTLNQKDRDLLIQIRKDKNFLGCAVLLKSFLFLGYPPGDKGAIPEMVVERMSIQLDALCQDIVDTF